MIGFNSELMEKHKNLESPFSLVSVDNPTTLANGGFKNGI